jgi:hypothetical protein
MRQRTAHAPLIWLLAALLAALVSGCSHAVSVSAPWDRPSPPAGLTLQDIRSVDDLRQVFNRDAGDPRLLLLVSPT